GKSTLLNMIGSLQRPDAGTIRVDGEDITKLGSPAAYRRATVGFVFQLHHLLPILTAGGNVELPLIPTIGRRAPARGRGPGAGQPSATAARRRADRRPGLEVEPARAGPPGEHPRALRDDHARGVLRPRGGAERRPRGADGGRAGAGVASSAPATPAAVSSAPATPAAVSSAPATPAAVSSAGAYALLTAH